MTENIFAETRLIFLGGGETPNPLVEAENPEPQNQFDLPGKLEKGFEYSLKSKNTELSFAFQNPNLQKYLKEQQKKYAPPSDIEQAALKNIGEKFNLDEILENDISAKLNLFGQQLNFEGNTGPDRFQAEKLGLGLKLGENSLDTEYDFQEKEFSAKLGLGKDFSFFGDSEGSTGVDFSTKTPAGNFTGKVERARDGKIKASGIFTRGDLMGEISFSGDEIAAGLEKGRWSVEVSYNPKDDESVGIIKYELDF